VIEYIKDVAREQYQILLYSTPTIEAAEMALMRCKVVNAQTWLAIFAVTAEGTRQA
jgi:hypothetical protein